MVEITIIIPIYNRGYCLRRCLNSIKEQSFKNWECILIDDGSTDDCLEICRVFLMRYAVMSWLFFECKYLLSRLHILC